ncbi:hypothetical protein [Methanogenium organophilum]|uniref:Uncharacterized protein n=1 Tax=Methanogenium organophilum TaxID=2199 RepID=A0A9X9S2N1_METOG|nr:hypothetical protein [Methanogenium organophilum]WAI00397.1 hypothetical protein OU421_08130 [Methanogenium organophilum]
MQTEPGTIARGRGGTLSITIAEETYPLTRDDTHTLLTYGQSVPLARIGDRDVRPDKAIFGTTVIDGHITVHTSGRAVLVVTRTGLFSVPLASFRQVVRGEAVSAPLFPVMPDIMGCFV